MTDNPVRDDTLRLILSAGQEEYMEARLRERFMANACIAGVWLVLPALTLIMIRFFPDLLASMSPAGNDFKPIFLAGAILLFFMPFAAMVVIRNMYMARKWLAYYEDHVDFLDGYKRDTEAARESMETIATRFHMFSAAVLILTLFVWFFATLMYFKAGGFADELRDDIASPSDRDICALVRYGHPDAAKEAKLRKLTPARCEEVLDR